jgi:pyruvate dehydrogenase E2 component (dihydrolipoamide acetyltransferase)
MAAPKEARVPDIGGYDDVPVIEVLVAEGDTVAQDQGLVTLESDKATMEVPAPFAGVVRELKLKVGDTVSEGSVVALIEPEGASGEGEGKKDDKAASDGGKDKAGAKDKDGAKAKAESRDSAQATQDKPSQAKSGKAEAPAASGKAAAPPPPAREDPAREQAEDGPRTPPVAFDSDAVLPDKVPYASPAVRLFARELGVDLSQVAGSARGGRITKEDVQAFVKGVMAGGAGWRAARAAAAWTCCPGRRSTSQVRRGRATWSLSRIQKISGANLARNWAMIPHVTQFDDADITELEALRVRTRRTRARSRRARRPS